MIKNPKKYINGFTPFQCLRSNLDYKKQILEKKKETKVKLKIDLMFQHLSFPKNAYTQSKFSDTNEISNNSFRKTTKVAKSLKHLYKISETMFTNGSLNNPKENLEKFCLKNTMKVDSLPNLNLKKYCSLNNTYIFSSIRKYKKISQSQNTDECYLRHYS